MSDLILAIDQGTTSSRAIAFDRTGDIQALAQQEFTQHFPQNGWVEHDAEEIWATTLKVCRDVITQAGKRQIAAIGITNQRETCLFWDAESGKPLDRAIVWQDRRGAGLCESLREAGHEASIAAKTGLRLDSYFSATKAKWLLDNHAQARERASSGKLLFGTIDSFLIWKLTGGKRHVTDPTNACRTMLYNIHDQDWDDELLDLFAIPRDCLPSVCDNADDFGATDDKHFQRAIPITAAAGDQQAALVGQSCFQQGAIKSTYGTGCFVLMNTGATPAMSEHGLLTSIGYRLDGETAYVLEGSIFNAGTSIQWLRDQLGFLSDAEESEAMARSANPESGVHFVPAFTGLGAPHWDPHARGALLGLTRDTRPADIVKAALESVCYQTQDLLDAMYSDTKIKPQLLRVDGGMTENNWMMQYLANITGIDVERPLITETTALGVAVLAGRQLDWFQDLNEAAELWRLDQKFSSAIGSTQQDVLMQRWREAVKRTLSTFKN